MAEYVQDELPLFGEPILPGDRVRVLGLTYDDGSGVTGDGADHTDIGAGEHVGETGKVVALEANHKYPFAVQFTNGDEFMYHQSELERL